MDTGEIIWAWVTGLVRRVAVGSILFLLLSVSSMLLYLSATNRVGGLSALEADAASHSDLVDSFVDMADHAGELAGSKSRAAAMETIEPLRLSLLDAGRSGSPEFSCAPAWTEGLESLQRVPARLASDCRPNGDQCEVAHDRLKLDDLAGFEQGMASVEELLPTFEHACLGVASPPHFCSYYLAQRERGLAALNAMVSTHYRRDMPGIFRPTKEAGSGSCRARRTFLRSWAPVARQIDVTARPQSLADFERLGETVKEARVAIRSSDTPLSASPAGGALTLLIPKNVSLPLLHGLGLIAICYVYLNLRRLLKLTPSHQLDGMHELYALFPSSSQMFTAPAFGQLAMPPTSGTLLTRLPAFFASLLFGWIPYVACLISVLSAAGAVSVAFFSQGAEEFSKPASATSGMFVLVQVLMTIAVWYEQKRLAQRFEVWVAATQSPPAPPSPPATP